MRRQTLAPAMPKPKNREMDTQSTKPTLLLPSISTIKDAYQFRENPIDVVGTFSLLFLSFVLIVFGWPLLCAGYKNISFRKIVKKYPIERGSRACEKRTKQNGASEGIKIKRGKWCWYPVRRVKMLTMPPKLVNRKAIPLDAAAALFVFFIFVALILIRFFPTLGLCRK